LPLHTGRLILEWADGTRETIIDQSGYSVWTAIDKIPLGLAIAMVAVEDFRFFRHPGLDINQIYYALIENIRNLGFTYGASTITQQLVKNIWLVNDKSLSRKVAEAILALELESVLSKQEILEWYLNSIELAQGIYGVHAGSMYYFGKEPKALDFKQQVFLASVVHAPSWYTVHPCRALPRIKKLAVNMVEQKRITHIQAMALSNTACTSVAHRPQANASGLRKALLHLWPEKVRKGHDLVIRTGLDQRAQAALEQTMHDLRADGADVFVTDNESMGALVLASREGAERMLAADLMGQIRLLTNSQAIMLGKLITGVMTNRLTFSSQQVFAQPLDWSMLPMMEPDH
jgi:penicillin-binding protein 1A